MTKFSIEIKWGILFTLALIASAIIEKEAGLYSSRIDYYLLSTLFFAPVGLAVYILALREKKKIYFKGDMNWRQGFFSGVMITAVVALLVPLQKNVIYRVIAPEFFANAVLHNIKGGRTRAEAESYFNLASSIYDGISLTLSTGVVASAALAMLLKSKTK